MRRSLFGDAELRSVLHGVLPVIYTTVAKMAGEYVLLTAKSSIHHESLFVKPKSTGRVQALDKKVGVMIPYLRQSKRIDIHVISTKRKERYATPTSYAVSPDRAGQKIYGYVLDRKFGRRRPLDDHRATPPTPLTRATAGVGGTTSNLGRPARWPQAAPTPT